jgi:hypothetical protein
MVTGSRRVVSPRKWISRPESKPPPAVFSSVGRVPDAAFPGFEERPLGERAYRRRDLTRRFPESKSARSARGARAHRGRGGVGRRSGSRDHLGGAPDGRNQRPRFSRPTCQGKHRIRRPPGGTDCDLPRSRALRMTDDSADLRGDLVAFQLCGSSGIGTAPIAPADPPPGTRVWVIGREIRARSTRAYPGIVLLSSPSSILVRMAEPMDPSAGSAARRSVPRATKTVSPGGENWRRHPRSSPDRARAKQHGEPGMTGHGPLAVRAKSNEDRQPRGEGSWRRHPRSSPTGLEPNSTVNRG